MYRIEITTAVKPGRMEDAIADMQAANEVTQRLAGVTGRMFGAIMGASAFGGVKLTWDLESAEAYGRYEDAAGADPAFQVLIARIMGASSAWEIPAPREAFQQIL